MAKGDGGHNPNIAEAGRATRFKKGDPFASECGKKAGGAKKKLSDVADLLIDKMGADDERLLNALVDRIVYNAVKMGDKAFIDLLLKLLGQMPADSKNVNVSGASGDFTLKITGEDSAETGEDDADD